MTTELRISTKQQQQQWVRDYSSVYRRDQLHDPSLTLLRWPDAEEQMLRDADVAHAIGYRRHLIAGRDWAMTPRNESSPRGDMAVAVATELLGGIRHFTDVRLNLARAFFSGSRFGRIHGAPRVLTIGDGKPRTWWVPFRVEDVDKRMYRVVPNIDQETEKLTAHWERWDIVKQEFVPESKLDAVQTIRHVYQDDQATLGHGRALREALAWWWYAKQNVFAETLQAVERFSQGILHAKIAGARDAATGKTNEQLISDWMEVLEDMRARHVLVSDIEDQVEHVSMSSEGWEMMHTVRDELRSTIFTLVLGANLTTSANEGGSYALAEIQENSTEALIQYDRETLEETLTDDLVGCVWFKNHANLVELGVKDDMPRFTITQEKRQDPQERATVAQTLNSMGVQLSLDDVLEQTGFRKPEDGEDIIEGNTAPDPVQGFLPGFKKYQGHRDFSEIDPDWERER